MATDPIPAQLARIRDVYALHLARLAPLSKIDMDPVFKAQRVTELQGAISELDNQIANLTKGA